MAYNKENYKRIRAEYETKNIEAKAAAEARRAELQSRFPEIREIDATLSKTGMRILGEAMKGSEGLSGRIDRLRSEIEELSAIRAQILESHGFPADYSAVKYECEKCEDTGFVGTKMCECFRRRLTLAGYESSGIGRLLKKQSFESFDLSFYKRDRAEYEQMRENLEFCRKYVENFGKDDCKNLLLFGNTGLGKTHLSTSVAKELIDAGHDVLYVTAHSLFSEFEKEHFGKDASADTARFFSAELLIIDDLGTEASTKFTVSCLYNLLNTRLNTESATIINTNLNHAELMQTYSDRIVSRILGEYAQLKFAGQDVRLQKLRCSDK